MTKRESREVAVSEAVVDGRVYESKADVGSTHVEGDARAFGLPRRETHQAELGGGFRLVWQQHGRHADIMGLRGDDERFGRVLLSSSAWDLHRGWLGYGHAAAALAAMSRGAGVWLNWSGAALHPASVQWWLDSLRLAGRGGGHLESAMLALLETAHIAVAVGDANLGETQTPDVGYVAVAIPVAGPLVHGWLVVKTAPAEAVCFAP